MGRMGFVCLLLSVIALASPSEAEHRSSDIACCIRNPRCHTTLVVAHRGRGFDAPENSQQALRRAIQAGVAVIEVDLRRSEDGELFVLHDEWLNRTTCHKGAIAKTSAATLAGARMRNGEALPRFEDLYRLSRGAAVLDVHFKVDAVEQLAQWIDQNGSFDDIIFFADASGTLESAARVKRRYPKMMVMPRARSAADVTLITQTLGGLPPVIHQDFPTPDEVRRWHRRGVKVFAKSTDFEYLIPPLPFLGYQTLLATAVDFILTDSPRALLSRQRTGHAVSPCERR
jgi:glycerophosphoryl diester phosphodiesterase